KLAATVNKVTERNVMRNVVKLAGACGMSLALGIASVHAEERTIAHWNSPTSGAPAGTDSVLPQGSKIKIEVLEATGRVPYVEVWKSGVLSVIGGGAWKAGEKVVIEMPVEAKASIQGRNPYDACVMSVKEVDGGVAHELRMVRADDGKSLVRLRV